MAGKIGRNIPDYIYRALLARSGNKCAYPGCPRPIVNTKNIYEANLCHIESVSHKDQRYNPNLTEIEVNDYNNLMFMCLKHHVETNDEVVYTADVLRKMKYEHESKYVEKPFHIDMSHIYSLKKETEEYWLKVEDINKNKHVLPDLKVTINTQAEYNELSNEIVETVNSLESLIEIIDKKDQDKYWEIFNLGFPNHLNKIRIMLEHMTIKYLEEYISSNPDDMETKSKLENLRKDFLETSQTSGYAD
jgi:type III secretory pathway component EscV